MIKRCCLVCISVILSAFIFIYNLRGGELTDKEIDLSMLNNPNIAVRYEYAESTNIIKGIVREIRYIDGKHWCLTLDDPTDTLSWITAYITTKDAKKINIGDSVSVRGSFDYHEGENYTSISVGCVVWCLTMFPAQVISINT